MSKKRMLIFAHYYYPDVASTGQILKELAEGMTQKFDVFVICVIPSYEGKVAAEYKCQKYYFEEINGVKIIRVRVPEFSKGDKISRIKNITTYFFRALSACGKAGRQDYILTISQPPILGGLLGVFGKWRKRAKMIYCIQDYNPEQIISVGYLKNKFILSIAFLLDNFSCKHSDLIVTVGRDLVETLRNRFKNKKIPNYIMINNWIDEKEIYPLSAEDLGVISFKRKYGLMDKYIIMYSGNLGLYYDLENIIKVIGNFKGAKTKEGKDVLFVFVGAGSLLDKLLKYKKEKQLDNVVFIPYQNKEDLIYSLNAGDIHWCVNANGIKGVSCPSKAYGIMAVGKPILGVLEEGTEVRSLIEESGCGRCCKPGEYSEIEKLIRWSIEHDLEKMGIKGRIYLEEHLTKESSIEKYCEHIIKL